MQVLLFQNNFDKNLTHITQKPNRLAGVVVTVRYNLTDWSFCPVIFFPNQEKKQFLNGEKLSELENLMT